MAPGGFDFNSWQQQQSRSAAQEVPADTPDSLTTGAVNRAFQTIGRVFGVNPDMEGQGPLKDTNVGGGFSLSSISLVRDRSGVLAQILKYFTRELPQGLTDGSGGAADGDAGTASAGAMASGGDFSAPSAAMPPAVDNFVESYHGDKFTVVAASRADLGELSPPVTGSAMRDMGMGAGGVGV